MHVLTEPNSNHGLTVVPVKQNTALARRVLRYFVIINRGSVAASGSTGQPSDEMIHQHLLV